MVVAAAVAGAVAAAAVAALAAMAAAAMTTTTTTATTAAVAAAATLTHDHDHDGGRNSRTQAILQSKTPHPRVPWRALVEHHSHRSESDRCEMVLDERF